ncbi:MAG TPA: DUF11 domain-containing protein [Alphaproteobacteria bacterium]|nr:DUF11 domain-containing protein [Alphaproteobacteria bacterium]
MKSSKITKFSGAIAAAILFAVCIATPARAQVSATTLPATATSTDGLLTVTLSSSNPSGAVDVNTTYTWTATNNSRTAPLNGVILGSHWGDYCINTLGTAATNCPVAPPTGPTLISLTPGCGGQSPSEFPTDVAVLGIWCTPSTGVTLAPGASVSGSVTVRPGTGGPAFYTVYSAHTPLSGTGSGPLDPVINYRGVVAPAATDIQISGAASTGSPSVGSTFTYTYQVKNAGPWGTYGGIIFTDTLPAPLTFVGSAVTQATLDRTTGQEVQLTVQNACSAVGQTVVCPLRDMTNGGLTNQATITLTVAASGPAQLIANTASVHTAAPQDDSNTGNNSVTVSVASK